MTHPSGLKSVSLSWKNGKHGLYIYTIIEINNIYLQRIPRPF